MNTQKWINGIVIVMSLVLIVGIVVMYAFESGSTEPIIPVTGSHKFPSLLSGSRVHGKTCPATQPVQGEINESASPSLPIAF
ncbi:hypothetical protein ANAEL_02470 [Anaerolineales bacterium]|nr:hypothetical protein ANAEL_02470 [Anaerolineales bacterium]